MPKPSERGAESSAASAVAAEAAASAAKTRLCNTSRRILASLRCGIVYAQDMGANARGSKSGSIAEPHLP